MLIRFSHGLGDVTQFTVILKHLHRHRSGWNVDVRCGIGKHTALKGLCRRVYHDREPEPTETYDSVQDLGWWENYNAYDDRPNSKVTNCLAEVFGIKWEADLARYEIRVGAEALAKAAGWLRSNGVPEQDGRFRAVIAHYEGNTNPQRKNLTHWQARDVLEFIRLCGRIPVILDWDDRSPLIDHKTVLSPGVGKDDIWGGFGSGDAETIAALIRLSDAFIGIDSGPGKVASSTDTPSLICWTGHHPLQFHDPAENTTHLIPSHHRTMSPCSGRPKMCDFFVQYYHFRTYARDDGEDLVRQAKAWLKDVFGVSPPEEPKKMRLLLPSGIGDSMWALLKARHVTEGPLDIDLSGDPGREIDRRAIPFLKRFSFVRDVRVTDVSMLEDRHNPNDDQGRYRYLPDGVRGHHHLLVPNTPLEHGKRIEEWLPGVPIDWDVINEFSFAGTEKGAEDGKLMQPFAAFYLGPESAHCDEGHNWGWLWEPKHWIGLGQMLSARGLRICVVGASYDRSFWEKYVRPGVAESGQEWEDRAGEFEIGETFAFLKQAKFLISYQCGLGIVYHYMGGRVAMWWRPDGESAHPNRKLCFDNRMKDAWVRPGWEQNYMGLLYRRETPMDIIAEIDRREWCD
jgi:hypothetical protein